MATSNSLLGELLRVNPAVLEEKYRPRELSSRVLAPFIVRLDGVGFGKALHGFNEPRDIRVHSALLSATYTLISRYSFLGAYVVSDEVNVVVYPQTPYNGRTEKILSIFSSILSSKTSTILKRTLFFDARIIVVHSIKDIVKYLLFRARVGLGNYIGSIARRRNLWVKQRPSLREQVSFLVENNIISPLDLASWKALGSSITWSEKKIARRDPRTSREVVVKRRVPVVAVGPWKLIEAVNNIKL